MEEKQQENIFRKMVKFRSNWIEQIDNSFLSKDFKSNYKAIIDSRFNRLA